MTTPPIMTVTDELIAELERLAGKATGGDWEYRLGIIRTMPDSDGYVPIAVAPNAPKNWRAQRDLNLDYIAAAKPETMRALLAERAALLRDRARLDWLAGLDSHAQVLLPTQCVTDNIHSMRAAIDAAMQS